VGTCQTVRARRSERERGSALSRVSVDVTRDSGRWVGAEGNPNPLLVGGSVSSRKGRGRKCQKKNMDLIHLSFVRQRFQWSEKGVLHMERRVHWRRIDEK